MSLQFAFLGLGRMGEGISENLARKGNLEKPLMLWNRTTERTTKHSAAIGNCTIAESLRQVGAEADVIWTCLHDEESVLQTLKEVLSVGVMKGKLFVDNTTMSPDATNNLARLVLDAGAEFVAVPVFGEPRMAKAGALTLIPAGKAESVKRIMPYLNGVIGRAVVDLSDEEPGQASLLKFIGNVMIMTSMEAAAEMCVFAEKTNLGAPNILKLFEAVMPTAPHVPYTKQMINGDYYKGEVPVDVGKAIEVTSQVLRLAKARGVSLKSYEVAVQHLHDVRAEAGDEASIIGVYGAVKQESGLAYRNE